MFLRIHDYNVVLFLTILPIIWQQICVQAVWIVWHQPLFQLSCWLLCTWLAWNLQPDSMWSAFSLLRDRFSPTHIQDMQERFWWDPSRNFGTATWPFLHRFHFSLMQSWSYVKSISDQTAWTHLTLSVNPYAWLTLHFLYKYDPWLPVIASLDGISCN